MGQARVENRTLVHHQRGCDLVESGQRYPLYEMVEELMFQGISLIQNDLLASHFQKSFADDENANEIDRALNFSLIACCKVGFLGLCFSNSTARSLSGSRWPRSGKIMAKKNISHSAQVLYALALQDGIFGLEIWSKTLPLSSPTSTDLN